MKLDHTITTKYSVLPWMTIYWHMWWCEWYDLNRDLGDLVIWTIWKIDAFLPWKIPYKINYAWPCFGYKCSSPYVEHSKGVKFLLPTHGRTHGSSLGNTPVGFKLAACGLSGASPNRLCKPSCTSTYSPTPLTYLWIPFSGFTLAMLSLGSN